ncbi:MAG: EpsI family protein [Blastocatellia bacterium]|nr:EpsI family protein [Blastocatellia bacterium]
MNSSTKYFAMLIFLCAAAAYTTFLTQARERENVPARESFDQFPEQLGTWKLYNSQTLDQRVLGLLAPDDYISRTYINAEGRPVFLFIAYYLSQRSGKTLHSPQNCLPGAGWEIIQRGNLSLPDNARINDFTIAKENDRMITYYWYQGRGRVEANEYWDKIYGVQDAVFKNRTDAALVRVMVDSSDKPGVEEASRQAALDFINQLRPELVRFIPN